MISPRDCHGRKRTLRRLSNRIRTSSNATVNSLQRPSSSSNVAHRNARGKPTTNPETALEPYNPNDSLDKRDITFISFPVLATSPNGRHLADFSRVSEDYLPRDVPLPVSSLRVLPPGQIFKSERTL